MNTQFCGYLIIVSIVILVSFLTYQLITKELKKRIRKQEERLKRLSQTEAGQEILEQESKDREKRTNKIAPFINLGLLCSYLLLLSVGISGVILFIRDVYSGKKILDVLFTNKGYYLLSPILLIYSIYVIILFMSNGIKQKFKGNK